MPKRVAVTLSDDTLGQIKERAAEAGVSMHAWLVAAVEREAFRQLCQLQAKWNAEHPEEVAKADEDHRRWREWRASRDAGEDAATTRADV